jgi:hypothetical protein
MKKQFQVVLLFSLICTLLISACGNTPTPVPTVAAIVESPTSVPSATNTPNPCAPENLQAEVEKIHKLMREFDDGANLAASVPVDQLTPVISNLQRIRREAEDLPVPSCLVKLKTHQVNHMNIVIDTLIKLIGYANGTVGQDVINQGIALAKQEHDNYVIELAVVLGLTPVVPTAGVPPTQTTQTPTP